MTKCIPTHWVCFLWYLGQKLNESAFPHSKASLSQSSSYGIKFSYKRRPSRVKLRSLLAA